jgi:hypothetical protein
MPDFWIPGTAASVDDLVARIHRRIESFAAEQKLDQAQVEVELSNGAVLRLSSISAEPGYGFLTLVPHPEDGEPQEVIVPVGAIRRLTLSRAEAESPIGFSLPA